MIDYLETLLWKEGVGTARWPRRGKRISPGRQGTEEAAQAPDAGQRGAAAEAWSLEERRRTGEEGCAGTIEQAAQEDGQPDRCATPAGWSLAAQLGRSQQRIAQAAMGGQEVTPFALTESLEQRTTADWRWTGAVQRDARRYDGGFFLY